MAFLIVKKPGLLIFTNYPGELKDAATSTHKVC